MDMRVPVSVDDVRAASRRIRPIRTPLIRIGSPPSRPAVELWLKLECEQRSGSFKSRGARNFVARLLEGARPRGVITYSSGNHGRAVAEAARDADLPAIVTVPDHVDESKAEAIAAAGAEVVRAGPTSVSRRSRAEELARERGFRVIPPFDHPWIIEGQGTVALEILDEVPDLAGVWVPVGGGGLAAGITLVVRSLRPAATVYTVEPEGASPLAASLEKGERVRLETTDSIADGLLPLAVGELNFTILSECGVVPLRVTEESIAACFRQLREEWQVPCEPSAAVSSAPLLVGPMPDVNIEDGRHVAVVSGGNISPARLERILRSVP